MTELTSTRRAATRDTGIVGAVLLAGLGLGSMLLPGCEKAPDERAEVARPVRILTIAGPGERATVSYPGVIEGAQRAELAFEVSGKLIELPVTEGQEVEEDELLARLNPADFQSAVDAAESKYRTSRESLDRFREVFEKGAVSRQELDLHQRQFEVDQANYVSAQKALADTELRAPFAGHIGKIDVDNFANVRAQQPIMSLHNLSELEITINMPEQDWLRARPGMTLAQRTESVKPRVSLSSIKDRSFPATITEIAASADPVTRTIQGRAVFDPPDDISVRPGMSATLTIDIPAGLSTATAAILIPASAAIADKDGTMYVWRVAPDMTVSPAPVTVGTFEGPAIEIVAGLEIGDRVVVSGTQHLRDGMKVRELTD